MAPCNRSPDKMTITERDPAAIAGSIWGMAMTKTTVYLPQEPKAAVAREARLRGSSEAQVIHGGRFQVLPK